MKNWLIELSHRDTHTERSNSKKTPAYIITLIIGYKLSEWDNTNNKHQEVKAQTRREKNPNQTRPNHINHINHQHFNIN